MKQALSLWLAPRRHKVILLGLVALIASVPLPVNSTALLDQGRRVYNDGLAVDGAPLAAVGAADVNVSGFDAACARCHRGSGMGSREGSIPVPAIAGSVLYSDLKPPPPARPGHHNFRVMPQRHQARPAYDEGTLAKALRDGRDSLGRPLNPLMPRYAMDDPTLHALNAFLLQLSTAVPPGLEGATLHLATVITPDADKVRAETVSDTLTAWAAQSPNKHIALHVWRLTGAPTSWEGQLEQFYRERPVYAILSGAGRGRWEPVQAFCESLATPCLFPVLDQIPEAHAAYYSMHLGGGLTLETRLLAQHLLRLPTRTSRIVQIYDDELGSAAAMDLQKHLSGANHETIRWTEDMRNKSLPNIERSDALILWLSPEHLAALATASPGGPGSPNTFLSERLCPPERTNLPQSWRGKVGWIAERRPPTDRHGRAVLGLVPWLDQLRMGRTDEATQSEVYAAIYFFNDALARMRGNPASEYLMDTLESSVDDRPAGASYFHLSLGPGQRVASHSGYILRFTGPKLEHLEADGAVLQP